MANDKATLPLWLLRTPSPATHATDCDMQHSRGRSLRHSFDGDSPRTPTSTSPAATSFQDTPITPHDALDSPSGFRSNPPSDGVQLKSHRLQAQINSETREANQGQILLFKAPGDFAELRIGEVIGRGQWSKVHRSWVTASKPTTRETVAARHAKIYAAKVADGRSAVRVIRNEARILTHLASKTRSDAYIVGFFGYDIQLNALVLEYLWRPHALGLLGALAEWPMSLQAIASGLVEGLDFLHDEGVIHGDIKPGNVYVRRLSPRRANALGLFCEDPVSSAAEVDVSVDYIYQPIYCDFSASRFDDLDSVPTESAGTYDYMAPELFVTPAQGSLPTTASDVYALGLTLICAAAGGGPYDTAPSALARRVMAMQGTPLSFLSADTLTMARFEASGLRSYVQTAIAKDAQDRCTARAWKEGMFK